MCIRSSLLCCFHFHLNVSRCRTVERTLGCDQRTAQEILKERITVALYKERLQNNQKSLAQLHVGPISIAGLALEPHALCRVELETLFPAASEPCGLMHGDDSKRDKCCSLIRYCGVALLIWSRSINSSRPAHHSCHDKTKHGLEKVQLGSSCPPAPRHDSAVKTAFSET